MVSLANSLIASAKGCNIPKIPTILGPCRIWILASTLRSARVKNAIEISMGISIISSCIKVSNMDM